MIDKYKALPTLRELVNSELKNFTRKQRKIIIRKFIEALSGATKRHNYNCLNFDYQLLRGCVTNELEYSQHASIINYMLTRFVENIDKQQWKEQKNAKKARS